MEPRVIRLLIPLAANPASNAPGCQVAHSIAMHTVGLQHIEAVLLHVMDPAHRSAAADRQSWQQHAEYRLAQARACIESTSRDLAKAGIAVRAEVRRGELIPTILDCAEDFACNEIVLPFLARGWSGRWRKTKSDLVLQHARAVPVALVDWQGKTVQSSSA